VGRLAVVIVLDTHVLVWFAEDNPRLGTRATRLTDGALQRDEVTVSAISFWEIAMLVEKRRLSLDLAPAALRHQVLAQGVRELALGGAIGIAAAQLTGFHPDPADRMIVATALSVGAILVTADDVILRWRGPLRTHDARR
jgi:PIN domain nuclease of toxin-antitoxin system